MSHEVSITVKHRGRWVNVPSVVRGRKISEQAAVTRLEKGRIKPLGNKTFSTAAAAVKAAKARSSAVPRKRK